VSHSCSSRLMSDRMHPCGATLTFFEAIRTAAGTVYSSPAQYVSEEPNQQT
jgi:hypothetical protein